MKTIVVKREGFFARMVKKIFRIPCRTEEDEKLAKLLFLETQKGVNRKFLDGE